MSLKKLIAQREKNQKKIQKLRDELKLAIVDEKALKAQIRDAIAQEK